MIDIAFSLTIPVFTWNGIALVIVVVAALLLYWLIRFIVSIVTG